MCCFVTIKLGKISIVRKIPLYLREYLKTHDVTGSEGFLRTAKRPAVRVRWEFPDTP